MAPRAALAALYALALACPALIAETAGPAAKADPTSSTEPAPLVSFDEAVAKAAANQPLILRAQAAVRAARARLGQARSSYLPRMDARASYDHSSVEEEIDLGSEAIGLKPKNAYDFGVDAGMLVYDFGKRELQVKLARNGVDSAVIGVDRITLDLAYEAARTYCDLLFLELGLKELDVEGAALAEHLGSAKKKAEEGTATRMDALATQLRLSRLEKRRIDVADEYAKRKIALGQLMGLPLDEDFDIEGEFPRAPAAGEAQPLVASALANRPELLSALKDESASELGASIAEKSRYPRIDVRGQAGYRNGILDSANQDASSLVFNWSLGVLVTMPLFDGFRASREIDEAVAKTEAAHQESEERRREAATRVLQALQDLSASGARTANAKAQVEQAAECLGMAQKQYDLGAGGNGEFLDALDALALAEQDGLEARLQEALGGLALRQALGERIWAAK